MRQPHIASTAIAAPARDIGQRGDPSSRPSLVRSKPVGIVIVSHSAQLAAGVCEVVAQMAPDVAIRPAGGTVDGGVGTSFDKILAAVKEADAGSGVVILYDVGSAKLSAELVAEIVEGARLVDAPLVEGAIAAAVTAQSGASIDVVAGDAAAAGGAPGTAPAARGDGGDADVTVVFTLRNRDGLHARPAAQLARIAGAYAVALRVGSAMAESLVDARSVLAVVALGLRGGSAIRVTVAGRRADEAVLAIEAAIEDGFGEHVTEPAPQLERPAVRAARSPAAIAASPGIAIGPIRTIRLAEPDVPDATGDPTVERAALDDALVQAHRALGAEHAALGDAHRALLADPQLVGHARAAIANGVAAAPAWWRAVRDARERLAASPDELIAQRAVDVTDVGLRVLSRLAPDHARTDLSNTAEAIVLADDLAPSIIEQLADAGVAGIALARSGATAHAAIVARGRGVPMLVQVGPPDDVADGTLAILDGDRGELTLAPDDDLVAEACARLAAARAARAAALEQARTAVVWRDGRTIAVAANVASLAEAVLARDSGADAIGLLRTELLYVNRPDLPSEDEQVAQLADILRVFAGCEVTIRTLDVGGDKHIPALALDPITHGFLGLRGLRYSLAHPETLRVQLRAILRAAASWKGTLSVMAPMVTTVEEVVAFRAAIDAAIVDLGRVPHRRPDHVGIMVETPAAAIAFDALAPHVDFASVGTNDLVQYVMAAERTNATVASLYRPDHLAVWRALEALARAAAGKKLAICGEMASHPDHARRLVELGVAELSMAPSSVPTIKAALRTLVG
jgi:phosphocarrier protein FPr